MVSEQTTQEQPIQLEEGGITKETKIEIETEIEKKIENTLKRKNCAIEDGEEEESEKNTHPGMIIANLTNEKLNATTTSEEGETEKLETTETQPETQPENSTAPAIEVIERKPRSANAFIIYRQEVAREYRAKGQAVANGDLSKIAGDRWKKESTAVLEYYRHRARTLQYERVDKPEEIPSNTISEASTTPRRTSRVKIDKVVSESSTVIPLDTPPETPSVTPEKEAAPAFESTTDALLIPEAVTNYPKPKKAKVYSALPLHSPQWLRVPPVSFSNKDARPRRFGPDTLMAQTKASLAQPQPQPHFSSSVLYHGGPAPPQPPRPASNPSPHSTRSYSPHIHPSQLPPNNQYPYMYNMPNAHPLPYHPSMPFPGYHTPSPRLDNYEAMPPAPIPFHAAPLGFQYQRPPAPYPPLPLHTTYYKNVDYSTGPGYLRRDKPEYGPNLSR